jgi:hypothetical protein
MTTHRNFVGDPRPRSLMNFSQCFRLRYNAFVSNSVDFRRCIKIVRARELFRANVLLFDVWVTIYKDDEVYSILIHWFLKASGFLLLEVLD